MLALLALQSAWQVWRAQPATAPHAADAARVPHW